MCKHCWDWNEGVHHKDWVRGYEEPEDFEKEVNYKPKKKDKAGPKKKPGCPGNEGKSHVYVYTTEYNIEDLFFLYFGFHKTEKRICAGCGKSGYKTRVTERYRKKFKSTNRWGGAESRHEGYREFRRRWLVQRGYTNEWYGNW